MPPSHEQTVLDLFEREVRASPEVTAVVEAHTRREITYAELSARADRLARSLRHSGVGEGDTIGISMERSVEMVVGILGILMSGAAYVPLDPTRPPAHLQRLIEEARLRLVLTRETLAERLEESGAEPVTIDASGPLARSDEGVAPPGRVRPADLAYVIFTSGSTGTPNGVQVTHGNLAYSTAARLDQYPARPRFLLLFPAAFDGSVAVIFGTLCRSGTLVLPGPGQERHPRALAEIVGSERVTHWSSIPSMYARLLEVAAPEQLQPLRTVILGGEACPRALAEQHARLLPEAALFNEYGCTEGTVWCSVYRYQPGETAKVLPIGRPLPGTELHILDEWGRSASEGELWIVGPGVAGRGYLNRPQLTGERFKPRGDVYCYKTGDLAAIRPDGTIEFRGRIDHQVKLNGHRIELEEIEAVTVGHPSILACAVTVHEQRLVAHIVPRLPDQTSPLDDLRAFLAENLPAHMVPQIYVSRAELPVGTTGKVDRKALSIPALSSLRGGVFALAQSEVEIQVAEILADIWQTSWTEINLLNTFRDLGGDSLTVIDFSFQLARRFGLELTEEEEIELLMLSPLQAVIRRVEQARAGDPVAEGSSA